MHWLSTRLLVLAGTAMYLSAPAWADTNQIDRDTSAISANVENSIPDPGP